MAAVSSSFLTQERFVTLAYTDRSRPRVSSAHWVDDTPAREVKCPLGSGGEMQSPLIGAASRLRPRSFD